MFTNKLILLYILILLTLTVSSGLGQIRYGNYSNKPLTIQEVAFVGKLLPIVAEYSEKIHLYRLEIGNLESRLSIRQVEIDILESDVKNWELFAEQIQAKWWQSPLAIIAYVVASFTIGVMVVL